MIVSILKVSWQNAYKLYDLDLHGNLTRLRFYDSIISQLSLEPRCYKKKNVPEICQSTLKIQNLDYKYKLGTYVLKN